ncbi:hypothetical protein CR51_00095 [Caballeronia megalochromosomata]|jgi:glycosyltransferase involved in cell wall biosynthesis|nr:hypothetical protein CR51_00095 [Caballeronia megalochromosomata]
MNKISVITISFNQGRFLKACIESVLSQAFPSVELIVVDPGSTDGSRELIQSYGDRLKPIFRPDAGPADGLNHGFEAATGDIFCFINADDFLLPDSLRFVNAFFDSRRQVDVLYGGGYFADKQGQLTRRCFPSLFEKRLFAYGAINTFQQGFFFRAHAFNGAGGFNVKNAVCWDGELFLKLKLEGYAFFGVSRPLGAFRQYQGTITGGNTYKAKLDAEYGRLFRMVTGRGFQKFDSLIEYFLLPVKKLTIVCIAVRSWALGYA